MLNDVLTRDGRKRVHEAAMSSYGFTEALTRNADPVHAMGMTSVLAERWRADRTQMLALQAAGSDRNADFTAFTRYIRLILQAAMLGLGAWLVIRGVILPASIFAANLLMGRALASMEQAVGGWRQLTAALDAGRRIQRELNEASATRRTIGLTPPTDL